MAQTMQRHDADILHRHPRRLLEQRLARRVAQRPQAFAQQPVVLGIAVAGTVARAPAPRAVIGGGEGAERVRCLVPGFDGAGLL
jgi:hypothetical protein